MLIKRPRLCICQQTEGNSLASDPLGVISKWPFVHSDFGGIFMVKTTHSAPQCWVQDEHQGVLYGRMNLEDE